MSVPGFEVEEMPSAQPAKEQPVSQQQRFDRECVVCTDEAKTWFVEKDSEGKFIRRYGFCVECLAESWAERCSTAVKSVWAEKA